MHLKVLRVDVIGKPVSILFEHGGQVKSQWLEKEKHQSYF